MWVGDVNYVEGERGKKLETSKEKKKKKEVKKKGPQSASNRGGKGKSPNGLVHLDAKRNEHTDLMSGSDCNRLKVMDSNL